MISSEICKKKTNVTYQVMLQITLNLYKIRFGLIKSFTVWVPDPVCLGSNPGSRVSSLSLTLLLIYKREIVPPQLSRRLVRSK